MTKPVDPSTSEELLPLKGMAESRGLTVLSMDPGAEDRPAHMLFASPEDAFEFLQHTSHHSAYIFGDQMVLSLLHPDTVNGPPRGKVTWLPKDTPSVTGVWLKQYKNL